MGANLPLKTMVSPVTGKLQAYALSEWLITCEPFTGDMESLRDGLNQDYATNNIDAVCKECKQFRFPSYDYLVIKNWVPVGSPFLETLITSKLMASLISFVIHWVLPAIVFVATAWALKEMVIMPFLHPRIYYALDGSGPYTREEMVTKNRALQVEQGLPPLVCPYCGQPFATQEELEAHMKECPWRPGVLDWLPWVVIGGVTIVTIVYIVPPLIRAIPRPRK